MNLRHGHARKGNWTPTYKTWAGMHNRRWNDYGGRGITVCERWMSFDNFLADMGERPEGMQLDRINNDIGYCKENCRWATRKQNCRNTRRNRIFILNGEAKCLSEWAEIFHIHPRVIYNRLRDGWSFEKSLTTPVRAMKNGWKWSKKR